VSGAGPQIISTDRREGVIALSLFGEGGLDVLERKGVNFTETGVQLARRPRS
jgi:hypothetical protein